MLRALYNQEIPNTYIKIIKDMCTHLKARIPTEMNGEYFEILKPIIFMYALEEIFKQLIWEDKGIKIRDEFINNLRFADDVILIAKNSHEL